MKIVYLLPCCTVSGGVAVVMQHANRLQARGHEVFLVNQQNDKETSWFPDQKVPVLTLAEYPADVDILVATGWSTSFQVARLEAQSKFYFVQSDETRFHPAESIWRHLTAVSYCFDFHYITEARWIQQWLQANFRQTSALVPNGIDPQLFFPCSPLQKKGSKPRVLLEGAIGLPYKGMAEAFAAIEPLDVEVWCVSSYGRPRPEWKCHRFFEQVPMVQMREIYSSCDILLKLSRVEGFFGPPMEMMACGGVPVVGRVTGYDEYIVDGGNALVVDPLDIPAATAAVRRLIDDPGLYRQLQAEGQETAARWGWEQTIDTLEELYSATRNVPSPAIQPYSANLNNSIAALYAMSTGEQDIQCEVLQSPPTFTNADLLCRKLQQQRWFSAVADLVARLYRVGKALRARLGYHA
ncbi:glycosyltransferase family 4 protein [Pelovirga terrestris]|uniref:Glycosyltransferase family 4 protein n=1 Tax=Pelovirga terrestris TaxID=2771352 RepID=A0A8J6QSZ8_9BACT|nr:glycosyltransferase family 4 protein [Pelovirga terrestris]MBD1401320.1 glycosyltransferase family 4 protein [Pelovirga terrestris]